MALKCPRRLMAYWRVPSCCLQVPVDIREGITDEQAMKMVDGLKVRLSCSSIFAHQIQRVVIVLTDCGGSSAHALSLLSCLAQLRSLQAVSSHGQQSCSQGFSGRARLSCIWKMLNHHAWLSAAGVG